MATLRTFIKRYSVLIYFALTFVISWGGFVLAAGPGGFSSSDWQADSSFAFAVMAMLAGPTIAGLLLTAITDGKAGFRKLFSELITWRLSPRWYAIAILPAPILMLIALLVLSLPAPIFTADNKTAVVMSGIIAGLTAIFEEIGWTGFAIPKLRSRYSVFSTGLIVGVMWGLWHLLQQIYISGTYTGEIPLAIYLSVAIFSAVAGLTAYRILLVWLYDRTGSLLVTTLMHASLIAFNIFIFRPEATGASFLTFGLVFTALQWLLVAGVAITNGWQLSQQPLRRRVA